MPPQVFAGNKPLGAGGFGFLGMGFNNNPMIVANQWLNWSLGIRSVRVPLERSIKEVIIPSIEQNFDMEGRPAWEPLTIDTIYQREIAGYGAGPILQRKRKLYRAAIAFARWTINGPEGRAYVSSASFTNVAPYARFMQNGAKINYKTQGKDIAWLEYANRPGVMVWANRYNMLQIRHGQIWDGESGEPVVKKTRLAGGKGIPARPFMLIQPEDNAKIEKIFLRWIQEKMAVSGAAVPMGTV